MCGIAGFWERTNHRPWGNCTGTIRRMTSMLAHRGPDDKGSWVDAPAGVALGHRRLAILDLSREGHQPMLSADGRYVLVFNGEIYNFRALRRELEPHGHSFRGHSDTEVMLAAFCQWGLHPALERFQGMFAFGLWDRDQRQLHLARDRAGEKPLYYGWVGDVLAFGSELKALRAHPGWQGRINRRALALLIRYGYIPGPHSIYEQIFKLPPGCALSVRESQLNARQVPAPAPYWSARATAEAGAADPFDGTPSEAAQQLRELLHQSVGRQMVADVTLGAFLSGGVDSSLVVSLMQAQSARPIKTFSIGFPQKQFDEAPFAQAVATRLGTDHTEWYVQDRDLQEVILQLPHIYDEPLADPSQIPTVLLCRLAGASVKVSLSGDAGDELFGGYDHYLKSQQLWRALRPIPQSWRQHLASPLQALTHTSLHWSIGHGQVRHWCNRLANLAEVLPASSDQALYQLLMSPNRAPQLWLRAAPEPATPPEVAQTWDRLPEPLQRMTWLDFVSYLPDDILVKVDRAAMAVGLETRVPLLDANLIRFAARLPSSFKQSGGRGKCVLRQVLYQYLPPALVDRPKKGFAAPIGPWLRGPLRPWAEELLAESRLQREGFFQAHVVRQKWQEHLFEQRDGSPGLWHVLMFQAWLSEQTPLPGQLVETAPQSETPDRLEGVCRS